MKEKILTVTLSKAKEWYKQGNELINLSLQLFTKEELEEEHSANKDYIDLGLSVKWATCNVGATYPEEYGEYLTFDEAIEKFNKDIGRMPTESEFNELCTKCKWEWVSINGHKGYKITGPNGKSIFLPAAGWRYGTTSYNVGMGGDYWSSTLSSSDSYGARYLYFDDSYHYASSYYRSYGQSVRLVIE